MNYVAAGDVVQINEREVGPNLVGDFGLLESAVARPQQTVGGEDAYPDVHSKAAALFESLVRNHPFIDGNKRTAVLSVGWFYALNGWWLMSTQDDLVQIALDVAEGRLKGVDAVAGRLQQLAKELSDPID